MKIRVYAGETVLNPKDGEFFQITIQRIDMTDLE